MSSVMVIVWSLNQCTTLRPLDSNPPVYSVHGFSQARKLEWVAISFWESSWPRDWTWVSWFFTPEPPGKPQISFASPVSPESFGINLICDVPKHMKMWRVQHMSPERTVSWVLCSLRMQSTYPGYSLLYDKDHWGPSRPELRGLALPCVILLFQPPLGCYVT